jgi:TP901 family phage tail tape measure protein
MIDQKGFNLVIKSMNRLGNSLDKVSTKGIRKFEQSLSTMAYRSARASALIDRYIVAPLQKVGRQAIQTASDVDKAFGEVQTLMEGSLIETTKRAELYRSELVELSTDVVKSVKDMTGGFYEYISAFTELSNTTEGFEIAAKIATAGLSTTTEAVDLLSSVSLAYGDTSTEMQQKIADLSFETVRLAKTHIPELAKNISKVAPVAAVMGVSLEDIFATSATLIGITGKTTEVFTQLRRVMTAMQKPNQTMVRLLESMGYVGYAAGKNLLADEGIVGAIQKLNQAAVASDTSIEKAVGRIQGIMPVLAFQSQETTERFNRMYDAMMNPRGATESALEKVLFGVAKQANAIERAKIQLENLSAELGRKLYPYLLRILEALADMLSKLLNKSTFPALETITSQIERLINAVANLSDKWVSRLTKLVMVLAGAAPVLGIFSTGLFAIEASLAVTRNAFGTFGTAVRAGLKNVTSLGGAISSVFRFLILNGAKLLKIFGGLGVAVGVFLFIRKVIKDTKSEMEEFTEAVVENARTQQEEYDELYETRQRQLDDLLNSEKSTKDKILGIQQARAQIESDIAKATYDYKKALLDKETLDKQIAAIEEASLFEKVRSWIFKADKEFQNFLKKIPLLGKLIGDDYWGEQYILPDKEALQKQSDELATIITGFKNNIVEFMEMSSDTAQAEAETLLNAYQKAFEGMSEAASKINLDFIDLSVVFDTSEMNKFNNIIGVTENEFVDMRNGIAEVLNKMDDLRGSEGSIFEGSIAEATRQLNEYYATILQGEDYQLFTEEQKQLLYDQYKEVWDWLGSIDLPVGQFEDFYNRLNLLASLDTLSAEQVYGELKDWHKYSMTFASITTLREKLSDTSGLSDVEIASLETGYVAMHKLQKNMSDAFRTTQRQKALIDRVGAEQALGPYGETFLEVQENADQVALATNGIREAYSDLAKAWEDGDTDKIKSSQKVIDKLEDQIEALQEIQTLGSLGSFGEVSLNMDTGKIEAELTGIGRIIEAMLQGTLDPMTGVFAILTNIALSVPEFQEVFNSLIGVVKKYFEVLGPAISAVIQPLIDSLGGIAIAISMMFIPILEELAPLFEMLGILLEAFVLPILSILSPFLAALAAIVEMLSPILKWFAINLIEATAPIQYLGTILFWLADTIRTAGHNIAEFISHPFRARKRDIWEMPDIQRALANTTNDINNQINRINAVDLTGAGAQGEELTNSNTFYGDLQYGTATSPYPSTDSGSGGGGAAANIDQFKQENYITINLGALAGDFDEFVLLIQRRLKELQESA